MAIYGFIPSLGLGLKCFFIAFFQYTTRAVLQFRIHIEHCGIWGKGDLFYDSQVQNCLNIKTSKFVESLSNYLSGWKAFRGFCETSSDLKN